MAAKTITLKHEGITYTLEFNRKSVEIMERQGFVLNDADTKPMTTFPALFAGAFIMHHKNVDKDLVDTMLYKIKNKESFLAKLVEMYSEPILTLMDEPDETDEGNVEWGASW